MSDDLQDCLDLVHVSAASPAPAAFIPGIPQAVVGVAHEHAPQLEGFLGLPRRQASVLKPGNDSAAMRRQARELRDAERPQRALADRKPSLPLGADLCRPPTRHCPFESRPCAGYSHARTARRKKPGGRTKTVRRTTAQPVRSIKDHRPRKAPTTYVS